MNGEGSDSVVIPLSRGYTLLFVVLALVMDPFAFFGMLALSTTGIVGTVIALVGSALVAVVTLQLVIQFVMPTWFGLRLDPEGFTVRMNLGSRRYRWVDVERFFVLIYVHLASVESCSRAAPRNQMLPGSPNKPAISAGSSTTNGSTSA